MPAPEVPAPAMPAPEASAPAMPAPEASAPDVPAPDVPAPEVPDAARLRMAVLLLAAAAVTIAYWVLWFADRGVVASETGRAYYEFENAFPLADGWLVLALAGSAWALLRRRPAALGWLLAGAGAGLYLFGMDVLYDIEHGIWAKGAGGGIELAINIATLVVSLGILRWTWRRRAALLTGGEATGL
ncbi:MAG: hypothetical protein ACYDD6_08140 [Acidimicrobiales bacterium]